MTPRPSRVSVIAAVAALLITALVAPAANASPATDSFYRYSGAKALKTIAPGTVLKTRSLSFHLIGVSLPLTAIQLLYRTTNDVGQPSVNVTSVIRPLVGFDATKALAYGSFYDSLNPADEPSYAISGGVTQGGTVSDAEFGLWATFLLQGYSVIIPDTQGETADFAAGPEYGTDTLDAIRAASNSPATGLSKQAKIGLIGYSGGAIATGWASALAPTYAPDVNRRLVGTAEGGVLVDPDHNLHYIEGSEVWAGVLAQALIGIARGSKINLKPYLNSYGLQLFAQMQDASIANVLGRYPGLTWAKIAKPVYATPEKIAIFVKAANALDLGSAPAPTVPMFIGQGSDGVLEGTSGFGMGDGVMVAGDVRAIALQYCKHGDLIDYNQYDATSHTTSVPLFLPPAISWLEARFAGEKAPQNCSSIQQGNSLAPIPTP